MKRVGIVSTAALSLLLGIAIPAYAQDEKHDQQNEKKDQPAKPAKAGEKRGPKAKPAQQQEKGSPEAKSAQQEERRAQQDKPAQEEKRGQEIKQSQQEERRAQQDKPARQNEQHTQGANHKQPQRTQQQQVEHTAWQQHRASNWQSDHRTWQQRGGYTGYRIPDDRFRGNFGREHEFRIYGLPFLVEGGYPRFQYSGYWFSMVDPWPGDWADDWYDTDDVYVVYVDNGYYLYNRRYPTVGIAINISM